MTKLGDIIKVGTHKRMWCACAKCGKERWVYIRKGKIENSLCKVCGINQGNKGKFMSAHPAWKGGRFILNGYIRVKLNPKDTFFVMTGQHGYILEHRLVMAKCLNRCLVKSEEVHHLNGIKSDNRIENLQLVSRLEHNIYTKMCSNCQLKKEIKLLQWQIKEQSEQIKLMTAQLMRL